MDANAIFQVLLSGLTDVQGNINQSLRDLGVVVGVDPGFGNDGTVVAVHHSDGRFEVIKKPQPPLPREDMQKRWEQARREAEKQRIAEEATRRYRERESKRKFVALNMSRMKRKG